MTKKKKFVIVWGKEKLIKHELDHGGFYYSIHYPKAKIFELGKEIKIIDNEKRFNT